MVSSAGFASLANSSDSNGLRVTALSRGAREQHGTRVIPTGDTGRPATTERFLKKKEGYPNG